MKKWILSSSFPVVMRYSLTQMRTHTLTHERITYCIRSLLFLVITERIILHSNEFEGPLPTDLANLKRLGE